MDKKSTVKNYLNRKNNGWRPTENRFVLYVDIMGFSNRVLGSNNEDIFRMMLGILGELKHIQVYAAPMGADPIEVRPINYVRATTYSDSVILYSIDGSQDSTEAILMSAAQLSSYLILHSIPFRGALAFGEMTLDYANSIFFGKPLIDAYQLEGKLMFYGIIVHGCAQKQIEEAQYPKWVQNEFTIWYKCPIKDGSGKHIAIVPSGLVIHNPEFTKALHAMRYTTSGPHRAFLDNTEEFLDYALEKMNKESKR